MADAFFKCTYYQPISSAYFKSVAAVRKTPVKQENFKERIDYRKAFFNNQTMLHIF